MRIEPTVGRVVHFYDPRAADPRKPLAAIIADVHDKDAAGRDRITVAVFTAKGHAANAREIILVQDDELPPDDPGAAWAEWMPYQKGQAVKTEAAEKALAGAILGAQAGAPIAFKREIERHRVNPTNDKIRVLVRDEPGAGGACHDYAVLLPDGLCSFIHFQNGPIAEAGVNGLTQEVLLAIVADRLQAFQAGPYACAENTNALQAVEAAMHWLHERTLARMARGVEGTHVV